MIDFSGVSKFFAGEAILDKVSFRIDPGRKVGVVGPNGAGKSTLFRLITGELSADGGTIAIPGDWRIGVMHQQLPIDEKKRSLLDFTADAVPEVVRWTEELHQIEHLLSGDATPAEEAGFSGVNLLDRHGKLQSKLEHAGAYRLHVEAEKALSNLGFPLDGLERPLSSFSGGWQMRAALARVLIAEPDALLLDEPSNYLDIPAVEYLCRYLNSYGGTLMLISHDRFLLRKLADVTLEVNANKATYYPGNYDYYREVRETRLKSLQAAKRNTDRKKEHLEKLIDRFRAKSSKAAQAKSWQKVLDKIEDVELPPELGYTGVIRFPKPPPCGAVALTLENISFGYEKNKKLFENVNFQLENSDKVALVGFNGTGKSTLLKLMVGALKPDAGKVILGHHAVIGYQAQEFDDILVGEQSVYDTVRSALPRNGALGDVPRILGSFGFSGDAMEKRCSVLSGGEKIRLCFARIFVNPPNILVLDEPTTHLDLNARELLQEALRQFKGALVLVSHDIEFVRNSASSILAMESTGFRKYFGNYDYYLEKSQSRSQRPENNGKDKNAAATLDNSKAKRQERARRRNELAAEKKSLQREVDALESRAAELETKMTELNQAMSSGEKIDFAVAGKDLAGAKMDLEFVMGKWESAAAELENIIEEMRKIAEEIK